MDTVPEITTERLVLKAHTREHLQAAAAMWADPIVVKHIGGRPFSVQETWFKILRYRGLWPVLGYGYWAVEERETGAFVGEVGLADFMRESVPSIAGQPEAGWAFTSQVHGKGYASEALAAMFNWIDLNLHLKSIVCFIDTENQVSIRVAQKCGFSHMQKVLVSGAPLLLLQRVTRLEP